MYVESYYLSEEGNFERLLESTDLAADEVEVLVGRFAKHSSRAGLLRGEVLIDSLGRHSIRHHFTKKILWEEL